MTFLTFTIPGDPVPMGRPRFRIMKPKMGKPFGVTYTDAKSRKAMQTVRDHAIMTMMKASAEVRIDVPICVQLTFGFVYPKNTPKKDIDYGAPRIKKPDVDNLAKLVLDACNGVCWKDDSQVAMLNIRKIYAPEPFTTVIISELDAPTDQ